MPWAPGPGGVAAEQMYMPGTPTLYGDSVIRGPKISWRMSLAPVHDVAADEVGVVRRPFALVVRAVWPDDAVPESRREPLDLGDDRLGGVTGVAVGTWA